MRFGCESVRLILRDLGHCHRVQWARSRGINPDSHPKWVDNSCFATIVVPTKYLDNDAKRLFLSERWVFFSKLSAIFVVLITWQTLDTTDQSASRKTFFYDYFLAFNGTTTALQGVVLWDYALLVPRASSILNELDKQ